MLPAGRLVYIKSSDAPSRGDFVAYNRKVFIFKPNGSSCHLFNTMDFQQRVASPAKRSVEKVHVFYQMEDWDFLNNKEKRHFLLECYEGKYDECICSEDFTQCFPTRRHMINEYLTKENNTEAKYEAEDCISLMLKYGVPVKNSIMQLISPISFQILPAEDSKHTPALSASHLLTSVSHTEAKKPLTKNQTTPQAKAPKRTGSTKVQTHVNEIEPDVQARLWFLTVKGSHNVKFINVVSVTASKTRNFTEYKILFTTEEAGLQWMNKNSCLGVKTRYKPKLHRFVQLKNKKMVKEMLTSDSDAINYWDCEGTSIIDVASDGMKEYIKCILKESGKSEVLDKLVKNE